MELALIAHRIREYRKFTGLNKSQFAEKVGVAFKTLNHLENDKGVSPESRKLFIAALTNKTIKPGDVPTYADGRRITKHPSAKVTPADLALPPAFVNEVDRMKGLITDYQSILRVWARTTGRTAIATNMLKLLDGIADGLGKPKLKIPIQRHCMILGVVQGFLVKEGVLCITRVIEDQNTLYYVDPNTPGGVTK